MNKNKGILKEGCNVTVYMADSSGNCVWSYKAVYKNGWFDHENSSKNARHDTPAMMDGYYAWYIVENTEAKCGLFCDIKTITDLAWDLYVLENHIKKGAEDSANYWHKMTQEDQIRYAFAAGRKSAEIAV